MVLTDRLVHSRGRIAADRRHSCHRNLSLTTGFSPPLSLPLRNLRDFGTNTRGQYTKRMNFTSDQRDIAPPAGGASAKRRRAAAQSVREARDRLTSTTGTRPAFDYELLRQFAQNRLSASLVILLLVGTVGFLSSLWTGAVTAGTWTAAVLMIHAVIITKCRQRSEEH